ncbi:hypothetical protein P3S67_001720 [Capsicum chacoense]
MGLGLFDGLGYLEGLRSFAFFHEPWISKLKKGLLISGAGLVGGMLVFLYMKKRQGNS